MTKIHHATLARAAKLGVEFREEEGEITLVRTADQWTSGGWETAKAALDALAAGEVEFLEPEAPEADDEDENTGRLRSGVMPIDYHRLYTQNGGGCGDTLDREMREAFLKPTGLDTEALQTWAKSVGHSLWKSEYETLNPGMQRMNFANRLRAYLRNIDDTVAHPITGEQTRFGIGMKPRKSRKSAKAK